MSFCVNNFSSTKVRIVAPIGGFGNHVRNLLLLDDKFVFRFVPTNQYYNVFAGPSWPGYNDYCDQGIEAADQALIKTEIQQLCQQHYELDRWLLTTKDQKLKFLYDKVYPMGRTWHNWLNFEWSWRTLLNDVMPFAHDLADCQDTSKTLYITCDPEIALKSYIKFSPSLGGQTSEQFLRTVTKFNEFGHSINNPQILVLSSSCLVSSTLDQKFYNLMVNWLAFDNHYNCADKVHHRWHHLQCEAEQDFNQSYDPVSQAVNLFCDGETIS